MSATRTANKRGFDWFDVRTVQTFRQTKARKRVNTDELLKGPVMRTAGKVAPSQHDTTQHGVIITGLH